ncbi:hypothetical protein [Nonomuraea jabiensis]|uniref:Uncharacterized protein n=1 Tax=Nonomuraea jabiensis TaxID=882448 RepID=A0A7W9GDG9_9ACTN|nr:hypothetical protein [Nonomuraea jabiensis]MBB5781790.1 hypothetical protein [Nonomuraea jabiensis]
MTKEELRQSCAERDLQRERAVAAEQQAHAAQAEREREAEQVRELRDRLAAAQAAAGLVLPELADLSGDLGDDVHRVRLPEAGPAGRLGPAARGQASMETLAYW